MSLFTLVRRRPAIFCGLLGAACLLPARARGQAEPAPPGSVPPPPSPVPAPAPAQRPARVRVAADLRFSGLFGDVAQAAAPLGWGFGLQLSAAPLPLGPLRLGFVLDFAQDRFQRTIQMGQMGQAGAASLEPPQLLVHSTFAAQALLDLPTRFVRPYLAAGPGLSVARHDSPLPDLEAATPQTLDMGTLPLVRVSAGLAVSPLRWFEIGVSAELSFTFSDQRGGVRDEGGAPTRATTQLFSPGWGSLGTWVGYCFY